MAHVLPGEVTTASIAWESDKTCQVEHLSEPVSHEESHLSPKTAHRPKFKAPIARNTNSKERLNQAVRLDVLIDYFKESDFLQDHARQIWLMEDRLQRLRTEMLKLQESTRHRVPHVTDHTDSTWDTESHQVDQECNGLRAVAFPASPKSEEGTALRRFIPKPHELPKAFSKLALSPPVSEVDIEDSANSLSVFKTVTSTGGKSGTNVETGSHSKRSFAEDSHRLGAHLVHFSERAHTPIFVDAETMKDKIRKAISQKPYRVEDLYKTTGWPQAIARHAWFEFFTLAIIAVNSVWISVDIDMNDATSVLEAELPFMVIDNFFLLFFTFEWIVRFLAFDIKKTSVQDGWFIFDSVLLFLMWVDTYILPIWLEVTKFKGAGDTSVFKLLRMMRITRMARMARLLKALPELTILIKGIWVAARSVFFTLWLLGIIIYIFAVAFRQLTDGNDIGQEYFKSVPFSMKSLLLYGVLPDQSEMINKISDEHFLLGAFSLLFILLASLTVMNMLIGVLVEVVSVVSSVEKEELKVNFVMSRLKYMLETSGLDANHDMKISKKELEVLLVDPDAAKIIMDVGVDPVGLVDFADYIFAEDDTLTFPKFIEVVLQFRGSNTATVRDVVDLRKFSMDRFVEIREVIESQKELLTKLLSGSDLVRECLSKRSTNNNLPYDSELVKRPSYHSPQPPTVAALHTLKSGTQHALQ